MNVFHIRSKIIVTCSNRIAPYLQKEAEALGYVPNRVFKTGIELDGTMSDCIRLNMHLTCASQVLFSINTFRAFNADDLYKALKNIEWERIIPADGYFSISSNVSNPNITNNLFANVKMKDAIADRFRDLTGSRPDSGSALNRAVIHLYWKDDFVEIFVDTSGETLSKHGYRKIPGKAPMLESLAAANLLALRWDGKTPFINPMCGSGTMAIEAALRASGRKPGLLRSNYAFQHLVGYEHKFYEKCHQELLSTIDDDVNVVIVASDISEDAVNISRINAGIAGVADLIRFECCDFEKTLIPDNGGGVVFFNPEYGDRLGEEIALQPTYARMGDFLKQQCKGYMGYIFTGNLELAKKIGLKPKRRIEFYNGKIDCRLFEYELYAGSREGRIEGLMV
jgi:putative N6-adenine-specific DNA methylase